MSKQLTLKERVRAIQPGTRIFDKIWTRCSPDNPNYASHMEQLFEAEVINAALVAFIRRIANGQYHCELALMEDATAALRDAGEPL